MSQGKGSTRRPAHISKGEWDARWEQTFAEQCERQSRAFHRRIGEMMYGKSTATPPEPVGIMAERTFPKKAPRSLQEREREDANNYAEHDRRLRHSLKLHAPLDGTKFPDQTVSRETSVYKIANNNGQQVGE